MKLLCLRLRLAWIDARIAWREARLAVALEQANSHSAELRRLRERAMNLEVQATLARAWL
jgi:hypothetical protein